MKQVEVVLDNKEYRCSIGEPVRLKVNVNNIGKKGDEFIVERIETNNSKNPLDFYIIFSSLKADGPRGLSLWIGHFMTSFSVGKEFVASPMKIVNDVFFGNRNLKGMLCKVIANYGKGNNYVFVETEENVGGGGCDGLGKKGHCVLVGRKDIMPFNKEQEGGK